MEFTIDQQKKELRKRIRKELMELPADVARVSDDALFERFLALPQVQQAKTMFGFWGIPGREPETGRLIHILMEQGKRDEELLKALELE